TRFKGSSSASAVRGRAARAAAVMIRFMTIDPNGIGNELHNCPRNKGAIAVRLRLNPALSPPFYEHRNSEAGAYIPIVMREPIALDSNYEPGLASPSRKGEALSGTVTY
ncbi:MAG: hypothetical protein WBS14_07395, partial [Rhodomicrobium sp.]